MKRIDWDEMIRSLVLVRLGQELGCDSPITRTIHDTISIVLMFCGIIV